ncbi:hypothetical protein [Streptomyces chumphonensis]|uniref:hypothetical protein n=1 Tax=Streptomyces chumphonensis TaxID=1214925 RepID=UPI003D75DF63
MTAVTGPVQPALDGTLPPARTRVDDFDEWLDGIRPAFTEVAATGREFTTYEIADTHQLPDPPNPAAHWGLAMSIFRHEGLVERAGWACTGRPTAHHSGVRTWRGTRAAQQGRAA